MTIYKFPSDFGRGRDRKKEKKTPLHHPEFIDIEDLHKEESLHDVEYSELYQSGELEKANLPFALRLFTFGVSIALFTGSFLLAWLTGFVGLLALVTFLQVPSIATRFFQYWRYCRRLFVTALGLLITCFSPALGMGFIAIYFALQGESVEENFLQRFLKRPR